MAALSKVAWFLWRHTEGLVNGGQVKRVITKSKGKYVNVYILKAGGNE